MNKRVCVFAILVLAFLLNAEHVQLSNSNENSRMQYQQISAGESVIHFNLESYEQTSQHFNTQTYAQISCAGEGETFDVGMPQLPLITRFIAIPAGANISFDIEQIDTAYHDELVPAPRQEDDNPIASDATMFTIDNDFYTSGSIYPAQIVTVGEPAIFRDFTIAAITIAPFQYDPQTQTTRVTTQATLRLSWDASRPAAPEHAVSRTFDPIYRAMILNYDDLTRDAEFQQPAYLFITPNDAQVLQTLDVLAEWKREMGFEVTIATTSETGTSLSSIKSYITNAYNLWQPRPEIICLVGDASGSYNIPCGFQGSGNGDYQYTLLEGNDLYPEVTIGRLSFNSVFEFQTIVSKILQYEKSPYMGDTQWYEHALLVGDTSSSGQSCIDTNLYIKDVIAYNQPQFEFYEVYSSPFVNQMTNAFNAGVSYFNYRGYIGMSGWQTSNVNNLSNGLMLPVAIDLTCATGNYSSGTSMNEAFLRAGTPSAPAGGIAGIATATSSTHTTFNNSVCAGIFGGIFAENIDNLGAALVRGKMNMYTSFPQNPSNWVTNFCHWNNLMGDPGMKVWTSVPQEIVVTADSEISVGQNYLTVDVTQGIGQPIAGAWVTLYRQSDDFVETGYTDENGHIILNCLTTSTDDFTLTVTSHDCIPVQNTIAVAQQTAFLNVESLTVDDDNSGNSSGNSDGEINPGETIELEIALRNSGSQSISGISAQLSTASPLAVITGNNATYPSISAGNTGSGNEAYVIEISEEIQACDVIECLLNISDGAGNSWEDIVILDLAAPLVQVTDVAVQDMGNNVLDPGETADIELTLTNSGGFSETSLDAILHIPNSQITLVDSIGSFSGIAAGGSSSNSLNLFTVEASSQLYPGMQVPAILTITNTNGVSHDLAFVIEIGTVTQGDPLGSDSYGYICFDDGDINYATAPQYNWIEIDPTYGGNGSTLSLNDSGDGGAITTVNMPFNFMFYGQIYDEITICTNGWISPGETAARDYMNWPVPGPQGPSPIIAAFWDDLTTSGGHVCTYHDQINHYFVVEWSHMKNDYDENYEETFEVVIYDPSFYPTATGDSEILMQYKEFNNINVGSYNSYHVSQGQYCTVGLEDPSSLQGLQYTFNNTYPAAAKPLQDEMAIFYTVNSGAVLDPPVIVTNPDSLYFAVDQTGTYQQNITLQNAGQATMMFSLSKYYVDGGMRNAGGPDDFGHMWFDSNEPNGPSYSWRELTPTATEVTFTSNDVGTDLMPIGFDFNFYGSIYNQFRINPNGWIGFGDDVTEWNNLSLPHPNAPRPAIMPFWDDLDPLTNGSVYYESYDDSLIVWYDGVDHYSGNYNGNYTFQVIIHSDGDIRFQYQSMTGDINSATIGIQNEDNSDALQLTYNTLFVDDELAVEIKRVVDWMTVSPESGVISGGDQINLIVQVEPQMLLMGDYECRLSITSNDPNNTITNIPVVMDVVGSVPVINVSTNTVDFGEVQMNTTCTDTVIVQNLGIADLEITAVTSTNATITPEQTTYTIQPYESAELLLTFAPVELGIQQAEITIFSNDTNNPELVISATGVGIENTGTGIQVPMVTTLYQNYPNPFNPETTLSFSLKEPSQTTLAIYNIKGEKVKTLIDAQLQSGRYEIRWNGTDANSRPVASGLYFSRFQAKNKVVTKKMMLLK